MKLNIPITQPIVANNGLVDKIWINYFLDLTNNATAPITLSAGQIGFGSPTNQLIGSPDLTFISNTLSVPALKIGNINGILYANNGNILNITIGTTGQLLSIDSSGNYKWIDNTVTPITGVVNIGSGIGIFKDIVSQNIELKSLNNGSNKLSIIDNTNDISFDVVPSNILINDLSGILISSKGGTGNSSYTLGDTLYASDVTTLSKLAGNISTTQKFLSQTGNDSISAAPIWTQIIPGTTFSASTLTGTTNQVYLSASGTGVLLGALDITLSLPQNIDTAANVQFKTLGLGVAPATSTILYISGNNHVTIGTNQYGILSDFQSYVATSTYGIYSRIQIRPVDIVTNAYAFYADTAVLGAGSTLVNNYGIVIKNQGIAEYNYGLFIDDQIFAPAIATYSIYTKQGSILFGDITGIGTIDSSTVFNVRTPITLSGVSQFGIKSHPQFAIDAVTATTLYLQLETVNNTHLTTGYGLFIDGCIAATGFTVANQYGLYIQNQDEGTSLNYSIYTGTGLVRFGDKVKIDISGVSNSTNLQITDTTSGAGIQFGGDTNLYRVSSASLRTNGLFTANALTIITGSNTIAGITYFTDSTNTTAANTGAVQITGGTYIAKSLYVAQVSSIGTPPITATAFYIGGGSVLTSVNTAQTGLYVSPTGNTDATASWVAIDVQSRTQTSGISVGIQIDSAVAVASTPSIVYGLRIFDQLVGTTNYAINTGLGKILFGALAGTGTRFVTADSTGLLSSTVTTGYISSTLTSAHILVGNGSNVATDVAMSGDISINNTGVTAIGANKVIVTSMLSQIATASVLGRTTAGTGNVEVLSISTILSAYPTGSGTLNQIPLWTTTTSLGDSVMSQSFGGIYVNGLLQSNQGIQNVITTAGGTSVINIQNTNNSNSGSNALLGILTGGSAAGDPFISFNILSATTFTIGLDNSDSDNFKISGSGTLGTTDYLIITTAGVITFLGNGGFGDTSSGTVLHVNNGSVLTGTSQYGITSVSTFTSAATTQGTAIYAKYNNANGSYTVTNAIGIQIDGFTKGTSSTINNQYGLYINNQDQGGTTNYAIYTNNGIVKFNDSTQSTSSSTGSLQLIGGAGISKNLNVGGIAAIGVSTSTAIGLNVGGGNLITTGTTQYGMKSDLKSDATVSSIGIYSIVEVSASVTVTAAYGVYINSASLGSSAAITTNYGLFVGDQSAGSTNYAIYTGAGLVKINDSTQSTNATTGALQVVGGAAINKNLNVGGIAAIGGFTSVQVGLYVGVGNTITSTSASQYGIISNPTYSTAATTLGCAILAQLRSATASYTMTSGYGVYIDACIPGAGSTITTQYGLFIDHQDSGTTNYAIYTKAGYNLLGDRTGIGSTSAGTAFRIDTPTNLSGTSQYGLTSLVTFTSAATTQGTAGYFKVNNASGSYTMSNAIGIQIDAFTKGASSTITIQYGLYINNQDQGGTSNYAIYTNNGLNSFGQTVSIRGYAAPASGTSVEIDYGGVGSTGRIFAYDRTGSVYKAFRIGPSFNIDPSGVVAIGVGTSTDRALYIGGSNIITTGSSQFGIVCNPMFDNSATADSYGIYVRVTTTSSFTASSMAGIRIDDANRGSGTTIQAQYGLFINDMTQGNPSNYAIYTGAGLNAFGDQVYVRTTGKNSFVLNSSGTDYGFISNPSSNTWTLSHGTVLGTLGTAVATWNASGIFTVNGTLALNNTINNGVSNVVTHKMVMSVNGTTYYFHCDIVGA